VQQVLALALEARGSVWHNTLALGGSDLTTQVGLARFAEFALLALGGAAPVSFVDLPSWTSLLESDDIVARLDRGHALTHGLDNTSTLMSQDDWESTFGVLARECVCICSFHQPVFLRVVGCLRTRMADTRVMNLNADLVGLGWCDLDVLDAEVLASFPGDGGLSSVSRKLQARSDSSTYLAGDGLPSTSVSFVEMTFLAALTLPTVSADMIAVF
jgi:hypothetical protein